MAGPSGDTARERAGELGEYHHSRNLMKKIAVGRRTFRLSRNSRGEDSKSLRNFAKRPCDSFVEGVLPCDVCRTASWENISTVVCVTNRDTYHVICAQTAYIHPNPTKPWPVVRGLVKQVCHIADQ